MKAKTIILGVSASIAIYKACEIVRRLMSQGYRISVVMTEHAAQLISPRIFASLSGNRVYCAMFSDTGLPQIEHISLSKEAGLVLIAPATANIIAKIACGVADDLLTTLVTALRVPVLIAPAMNENMFGNKIVQANIKKLKELGYRFIEPQRGNLACGDVGWGRLADTETIVKEVKRAL